LVAAVMRRYMTRKKIVVIILCALLEGCASIIEHDMQTDNPGTIDTKRQVIGVYDKRGNIREHVIIKDGYITIYDRERKIS